MSEFTFPRKKRSVKEKVISFTDEPKSDPIYSTLSKKPADLKTTDIDLTAIRVFLVDGSHRTISSTPETTCGEILDRLLEKLGLTERRTEYALQIKYTFSEPRIADDGEQISKLNVHVWDSVDRIYLSKKDIDSSPTPPLLRKKRLASFHGVVEQEYSLHDNCAVIDKHMVETDTMHAQQPVLVNEQLASTFARAWSVGSEKEQAGESGGQKPMPNTVVFHPARINFEEVKPNFSPKMEERRNTYTPECKPKDSTIRRRPPISPKNVPESSPHRFTRRANSQGCLSKERNARTTSSLQLPTCSETPPIPLTVPERISAYLQNCTIPDKELLKQGKRMSQMLQLTPKKEVLESKPLRTLQVAFNKFGTLLRKARNSSDSSSSSPPPTSGKKGLGFPDSPVSRRQETHALELGISSPKTLAVGVRMSPVEDDQVFFGENQNPSLDCPRGSTSPVATGEPTSAVTLPLMDPSSCDIATTVNPEEPAEMNSMGVKFSHVEYDQVNPSLDCPKGNTVPRPKVQVVSRRRTIIEEYDIAVPFKIPTREHNYHRTTSLSSFTTLPLHSHFNQP